MGLLAMAYLHKLELHPDRITCRSNGLILNSLELETQRDYLYPIISKEVCLLVFNETL